jgi:hypothetical protein
MVTEIRYDAVETLMPLVVLEYVCDGSMFVPFWSCEDYS